MQPLACVNAWCQKWRMQINYDKGFFEKLGKAVLGQGPQRRSRDLVRAIKMFVELESMRTPRATKALAAGPRPPRSSERQCCGFTRQQKSTSQS